MSKVWPYFTYATICAAIYMYMYMYYVILLPAARWTRINFSMYTHMLCFNCWVPLIPMYVHAHVYVKGTFTFVNCTPWIENWNIQSCVETKCITGPHDIHVRKAFFYSISDVNIFPGWRRGISNGSIKLCSDYKWNHRNLCRYMYIHVCTCTCMCADRCLSSQLYIRMYMHMYMYYWH